MSSRLPVFILSPTRAVDASPVYLECTACQSAAAAIDSLGNAFRHLPYETIDRGVLWQLLTLAVYLGESARGTRAVAAAPVAGMMENFTSLMGFKQTEDLYRVKAKLSTVKEV